MTKTAHADLTVELASPFEHEPKSPSDKVADVEPSPPLVGGGQGGLDREPNLEAGDDEVHDDDCARIARQMRAREHCNGHLLGGRRCNALEGHLHRLGCDQERCTRCSGQYLYCDCPEPLRKRKRVPFFRLTWLRCERCGMPWPEIFMVPDDVWRHYILALGHGDKMLCFECFKLIAQLTDGGAYAAERGGARICRTGEVISLTRVASKKRKRR
jgi:hypothetical protein